MRDRLAADLLFFAGFCSVDSLSADSLSPAAARGYSFLQVLQVPPRLGRLASHSQHAKQAEQEGQFTGDATTAAVHHPAIKCSAAIEVICVVSGRAGALVPLTTTGALPAMLAVVLAVLVAMAEITSP